MANRFAVLILSCFSLAAFAAPPATAWATVAADTKWAPFNPADPKGNQVATVHGDWKGPTTFLLKVPAGRTSPVHFHTNDYYAVILSGAPVHGETEATAKAYTVGSTWFEPGKHNHFDACPGKEDCIAQISFPVGPVDFIPVGPDGKPLPPPPAVKAKTK